MHGHGAGVNGLSMLPGERLLSGAEDGSLRIFDPYWDETRQLVGVSAESAVLLLAETDVEGATIAFSMSANGAIVNELVTEEGGRRVLRPRGGAWAACERLGDLFVALADGGSSVFVVRPESGELITTLEGHDAKVVDLASDEMGYRLISGASDSRAIVWEGLDLGEEVESWDISHDRAVVAVGITPDGARVVTADKDKNVRVWDADLRAEVQAWEAAHTWQIQALAISTDGAMVASASKEKVSVHVVGSQDPPTSLGPHQADVGVVTFHPDGQRLFTGDTLGNVYLWDIESGDLLLELVGHDEAITALAMTADAMTLLSGDAGGLVYAWRSDRDTSRHERFQRGARRVLREEEILRFFEGDEAMAWERLSQGFRGLGKRDPAVVSLLERLAPRDGAASPGDGE
ncbi:MAG: hypothetical protein MK291_07655 [Planctomycetes bacterium]|nr:hypothetical protein [Planctomycetota bacterium]